MTFTDPLHATDKKRSIGDGDGESFKNALVAKSSYQKGKGKLGKCNHCHKNGHEVNDYYLHKGNPQCYDCKRFGHITRNCRFKNGEKEKIAQMVIEENLF